MSSQTPAHDFLLPRLKALIEEATGQGIASDVAVAVLTDLVTGPQFNTALPDPTADSEPRPPREAPPDQAARTVTEKNNLIEQVVTPRGYL